jgi:hypothetical protein
MRVTVRSVPRATAQRAGRVLVPFQKARSYCSANFPALVDRYEDQWVAVSDAGVIAHNRSRAALNKKLSKAQRDKVFVSFLTRKKQTLIL